MKGTQTKNMETLIDGTVLKEGVMGTDILPSAVSVVSVSVPNEGNACANSGVSVDVENVGAGTKHPENEENQLVSSGVVSDGETHIIHHVTLDQEQGNDVPLLSSDSISLPLANQSEVLQLQIQPDLDCKLGEGSFI